MKYFQGETIEGTIDSEDINLGEVDFAIWIYKHIKSPIVIEKKEMTLDDNGNYSFAISSEKTKDMPLGRYVVEMVVADDSVIIGKASAFELISSVSKGSLSYGDCEY